MWDLYSPENHFRCRCSLEQIDKFDDPIITSEADIEELRKELDKTVQPEFKMNPGKDGYIFSPEHPYFEVAPKDRQDAKDNFGLPIPEND